MGRQPLFADFTEVTLAHPVEAFDGVMPKGARGVVMAVYDDGLGYEVEFESPFHAVLTLEQGDLLTKMDMFE